MKIDVFDVIYDIQYILEKFSMISSIRYFVFFFE